MNSTNIDLTIASGASASSACPCAHWGSGSVQIPSTDISGAYIKYQTTNRIDTVGAPTGWADAVGVAGAAVATAAAAANVTIPVVASIFDSRFFRVVSASAEAGDRTLAVTLKDS